MFNSSIFGNQKISKKLFFSEESRVFPFNTFVYLLNEYANFGLLRKKDNCVEKLGEDVGVRIYEGMLFSGQNPSIKKEDRKIKMLDILNYIKYSLWPLLFEKPAGGLESFIGERKHSKTQQEIKEYVIFDQDPVYYLRYTKENFVMRFISGVVKGFLVYSGFPCRVIPEVVEDKEKKIKCEFIVMFDEATFENEN